MIIFKEFKCTELLLFVLNCYFLHITVYIVIKCYIFYNYVYIVLKYYIFYNCLVQFPSFSLILSEMSPSEGCIKVETPLRHIKKTFRLQLSECTGAVFTTLTSLLLLIPTVSYGLKPLQNCESSGDVILSIKILTGNVYFKLIFIAIMLLNKIRALLCTVLLYFEEKKNFK